MEEAVQATQVNKGTVVSNILDHTLMGVTQLDITKEFTPFLMALIRKKFPPRSLHDALFRIYLHDLEIIGLAKVVLLQFFRGRISNSSLLEENFDLRAVNTDGDNQSKFNSSLYTTDEN